VRRGLWKQIGSKRYSTVTSRTFNMPASVGALAFTIVARGRPIPIKEFPVKRIGSGVQASPWDVARVFERSYQERFAGGGYIPNAFFARAGEAREPVRVLFGPNLAKELLGITRHDETIADLFMRSARLEVPAQIIKALEAALG
jgi:hypothetical protein